MKYKFTKYFKKNQLEKLFLSVEWQSGNYPKELKKAMACSDTVISAWDKGELIGLMSAISDKKMNVFFPYLLIKPEYQGMGLGREIIKKMLKKYENFLRKSLTCYYDKLSFYEKFGFENHHGRFALTIEK